MKVNKKLLIFNDLRGYLAHLILNKFGKRYDFKEFDSFYPLLKVRNGSFHNFLGDALEGKSEKKLIVD